jgi:hypothetical protein
MSAAAPSIPEPTTWQRHCSALEGIAGDSGKLKELRKTAKFAKVENWRDASPSELCKSLADAYVQTNFADQMFRKGVDHLFSVSALLEVLVYDVAEELPKRVEGIQLLKAERGGILRTRIYQGADSLRVELLMPDEAIQGVEWFDPEALKTDLASEAFFVIVNNRYEGCSSTSADPELNELLWREGGISNHATALVIMREGSGLMSYRYEPLWQPNNERMKQVDGNVAFLLQDIWGVLPGKMENTRNLGAQMIHKGELCVFYCLYFLYLTLVLGHPTRAMKEIDDELGSGEYRGRFLDFMRLMYNLSRQKGITMAEYAYTQKPPLFMG